MVEGRAEICTDLEATLPLSIEIARQYMGEEQAAAFGARNAVPGNLPIRRVRTRPFALRDLAG